MSDPLYASTQLVTPPASTRPVRSTPRMSTRPFEPDTSPALPVRHSTRRALLPQFEEEISQSRSGQMGSPSGAVSVPILPPPGVCTYCTAPVIQVHPAFVVTHRSCWYQAALEAGYIQRVEYPIGTKENPIVLD